MNNLENILLRIREAEKKYHREPNSVSLLAVSKTKSVSMIREVYEAGQKTFGENYLQEALPKIEQLKNLKDIEFHFIGDIQSNKTKAIAENFNWVYSVNREKIARRLNEQRPLYLPPLNICIEVNVDDEPSKAGVSFSELEKLVQSISTLPHLKLRGLMCIPSTKEFLRIGINRPEYFGLSARRRGESNRSVYTIHDCCERQRRSGISREASLHAAERQTQGEFGWWVSAAGSGSLPTQSRKSKDEGYIPEYSENSLQRHASFAKLKKAFESLKQKGFALDTLSMGMSSDFELAILEGATMVRIGTAIFGKR